MKHKIGNLGDLSDFLQTLTVKTLQNPAKIIALNESPNAAISEVEITEEPFLVNKSDNSDGGYESELKREHGSLYSRKDYDELEPVGTIIFYAQ